MLALVVLSCLALALAIDIPMNEVQKGDFCLIQLKEKQALGPCGQKLDESSAFACVDRFYWGGEEDLKNNPLCKLCLDVSCQGKNYQVPIRERCSSDRRGHIELSQFALKQFGDLPDGRCDDVQWKFVKC